MWSGVIVIPILNPIWENNFLEELLVCAKISDFGILIIDSGDYILPIKDSRIVYLKIEKGYFNHGATRNTAVKSAGEYVKDNSILVFITQDIKPVSNDWLESLIRPILDDSVAATFSRQLPRREAGTLEEFSRLFNYPSHAILKTEESIKSMGVKAFFFSNSASAIRYSAFRDVGGFPEEYIMNEDMIIAAKLLRSGYKIRYTPESKVIHSHDYSLKQQFRRNFDVGAFFADAGAMLEGAAVGGEGFRFVREQLRYVVRRGRPDLLPLVVLEAGAKFSAFQLGKRHRFLPLSVKKRMSMHSYHWDQKKE